MQNWKKRETLVREVVREFERNNQLESCCGWEQPRSGVWATRPHVGSYNAKTRSEFGLTQAFDAPAPAIFAANEMVGFVLLKFEFR